MKTSLFLKLALIMILAGILTACNQPPPPNSKITVKYASTAAIVEAPAHVAFAQEFFTKEGLELDLKIYPDGKSSLEKVIAGEADIGSVMSTPLVYKSFTNQDYKIIANLLHGKIHLAVVTQASNIHVPHDFINKKIGVTRGTSGEFFMDSYFILEDINRNANEIVYSTAADSLDSLAEGTIDAIFTWAPWPFLALEKLKGEGRLLETSKIVPSSWVIVANKKFAENNPDALERFLRGFQKGIKFCTENREKAYEIHTNTTGFSPQLLMPLFAELRFSLSLSNRLIMDLEQQAEWLVRKGYVGSDAVPNYLNLVDSAPLKSVLPDNMTLIVK